MQSLDFKDLNKTNRRLTSELFKIEKDMINMYRSCNHEFIQIGLIRPIENNLGHYMYRCKKCNKKKFIMEE